MTKEEIEAYLERLKTCSPRKECRTCECLQGLIAQLEVDSSEDISNITKYLKCCDDELHQCLGCNPCPPADLYTEYLTKSK